MVLVYFEVVCVVDCGCVGLGVDVGYGDRLLGCVVLGW